MNIDSYRDEFSNELSLFMEMDHLPPHHPWLRITTGKDSVPDSVHLSVGLVQ